ncbi:MAG TPA: glycosyltransferase family 4 protein [Gaiellaceae bacterium]
MTRPLDVVLIANALGLGGTEKGLVTHARSFDPARVRVRVVEARENGPRAQELRAAGIDVAGAAGDIDALTPLLAGADVVHVFRSGGFEPLVPSAVRRAGVPVLVETNVFGQVDGSDDERLFSMHLFVSRFCAARYRERRGLGEDALFHDRHRVSTWPLDIERIAEEMPERRAARAALGLDPDRPVVVRVGRPDERKWRDLLAEMVPPLLDAVPNAQVLLVGAPPRGLRRLAALHVLDRVYLLPETPAEGVVLAAYAAADVVVSAAAIGESCSVAIAEAMVAGRPVVTSSTPWTDNAQIEQVNEGRTGHVADHPAAFADAVASLLLDPDRAAEYGEAARSHAVALHDARLLTRQLERLYEALAAGARPPTEWTPLPIEVDAFPAEYARRLDCSFRPLTVREHAEAARARRSERLRWLAGAAQRLDRGTAALAVSSLMGRRRR